jgi:uncharacterized YccA/Bax inhibitor family protein
MRTGNPVFSEKAFGDVTIHDASNAMTVQGTTNKAFALFGLVLLSASWVWSDPAKLAMYYMPALIVGLIVGMVTIFKKEWAMFTAPVYALIQGVVLGGLSAMFEKTYPGIVMQAVGLTFGTMFALLATYKAGFIKVTERFRSSIIAATGGVFVFYMVSMVLGFFGVNVGIISSNSLLGIGFSVVIVGIAAFNLILDFDFIERATRSGAPKYMEWYAAFGLMVTLIWLYMEILRLLSKLRSR